MPICASWFRRRISTARSNRIPHVAFDALERANDGLIALTAGAEGALARLIADGQHAKADAYLDRLASLVSRIASTSRSSRRDDAVEEASEAALIELAYARDLPLVATNPAAYADPGFHAAHDAMLCIASSAYVESADRETSSPDAWLKDRGGDGGAVRRSARSDRQHRGDRPALRGRRAAAQADPAAPQRRRGRAAAPRCSCRPCGRRLAEAAATTSGSPIASASISSSTSSPAWGSPATS